MPNNAKTVVLLSFFFLVQWRVFLIPFRWEYIVVSFALLSTGTVLYCLSQLWSVHKWIICTVYHLGVNCIYFVSLSRLFKVSFKTHCKFNEYGYFPRVIYHDNVWYLGCNTNVCGYCRDITFVVVTMQVGMNDPVCLFT